MVGFCLIFLVFGFWRIERSQFKIKNNDFVKYGFFDKNIVLTGVVVREPDVRERNIKLILAKIKLQTEDKEIPISGKILLNVPRYPEYKYGDLLKVRGIIQEPPVFEDFNYKDYLLKEGIFATISFPKIKLLKEDQLQGLTAQFYKGILWFKGKLRESIFQNFSPPQSLILEGIILGDNSALTPELKNKLNITGLRHVIAISGTHIVILSSILMSFSLLLGFWRGQAFYLSLIFIALYIILTGQPSSGVRAGIMGGILLLAQKLGRMNKSERTITLAGAIMLLINPLLLLKDVGFQLSFLASLGIIYLYPLLYSIKFTHFIPFLKFRKENRNLKFLYEKSDNFKSIMVVTISAQIFTLPILVFNFGNISLVSLITNILVLPFVSWLMIFGFLAGLLGIISGFLGWLFVFPSWILLTYFLKVMDFFSQDWAIKKIENVHWLWLIIFYFILGIIVRYFTKRARLKFLNY